MSIWTQKKEKSRRQHFSLEENFSYLSMKIKHITFLAICFFLVHNTLADTWDCSKEGLGKTPGSFGYHYYIELCEGFKPITKEAVDYIQSIKKFKGRTIREVITEIGEKFCRGDIGMCGEKSFSDRYKISCSTARGKAIKQTDDKYKSILTTDKAYTDSMIACPKRSDEMLESFKDVALQEAAKYDEKIIEDSNKKYLEKSHELMQNLTNTIGTVIKKLSSVAQHFEWFTEKAYSTGAQIMN